MIYKKVTIRNELGLHARIAAKVSQMCKGFDSAVTIRKGSVRAKGTSIIELLVLGAPKGSEVEIIVEGGDEVRNIEALEEIFSEAVPV